jgi:hypothetical protein
MGRLTLNVLLSFAQFEREVTGERIRDKIAASKKKGMWMGGNLPLGYDRKDNTLVINEIEADQVRKIFERYTAVGSVDKLQLELTATGVRSKRRITRAGATIGGNVFTRGALYHLLTNHHYCGLIRHKDQLHPGLHPALIDQKLFDAVQARLDSQRVERSTRTTRPAAARLVGRIFLANGVPLSPSFAYGKRGKAYSYYIAAPDGGPASSSALVPRRLPAAPLETFVRDTLARLSGDDAADWSILSPMLVKLEVRAEETHFVLDADKVAGSDHPDLVLDDLTARLRPAERLLTEADGRRLRVCIRRRLCFRGGRSWLLDQHDGRVSRPSIDPIMVAGLKRAHAILADVGVDTGARKFRRDARSPVSPYERKLCLLSMLSPKLQVAIIEGRVPKNVTLHDLIAGPPLPLLWREQEAWLLARRRQFSSAAEQT